MSITSGEMTPADIKAITCDNNGSWGGDWSAWIIIFLIFSMFGWGGNRGFGGASGSGAMDNYVLASDFATIQRQISDATNSTERKLDTITNGLCDLGYTEAQLINSVDKTVTTNGYETRNAITGIGTQLSNCCCDIKEGIAGVNYNIATTQNAIERQIERGFCDTNYNMATQHNATLQAIDKGIDRVVDYLNNQEMQRLRDDNNALRLSASQQMQNAYIVNSLTNTLKPQPIPAYTVPNPNCCYTNTTSCGCGV